MKLKSKIYYDYDDVLTMCHNLAHDISKFKPDMIVGITRGGLLPALHLSHALDRPMETVMWQTRETVKQEHSEYIQQAIDSLKRVVFVDDINDTGRTFNEISKAYHCERPNVRFTSLVKKVGTTYPDGKAALTISDKRWIVFPWEKD
jgi:hypoxanthine phosphoribosyltransferase